ncbi:MAG TPA: hypothetical protein VIG99_17205 [Myxococcaceae bacterium]|jgi:hypothetical protein
MSPTALLYVQFYMSLLSFSLVAWRYWIPAMRARPFAAAVAPILLLHSFRHLGMMYLNPAVIPDPPDMGFSGPTAWGDLASAVLALVALGALRLDGLPARAAVWLFNVVGFADLGLATVNADRFQMLAKPIGVVYLLPAIVVPALLVTHVLAFWLLLRRAPAAAAAA